jgi:superfamily II DNA or RNA helicase
VEEKGNQVTIRKSGQLIQVDPDCRALLADELTYQRRKQKGGRYDEVEYETVQLFAVQDGMLLCPAGLERRVTRLLQDALYRVARIDCDEHALPAPAFDRLDLLRPGQEDMILALVENEMGIIEGPTGAGKSFVIRQVCKLWHEAKVIICSPHSGIVHQTYQELVQLFGTAQVGMVGGGVHDVGKRVLCVVDRSLEHCNLKDCDIFIYDEVHRAAAPKTSEVISHVAKARRYGFSATPEGRSDRADLATEALFGPVIHKVTYQEVQQTGQIVPISVVKVAAARLTPTTYDDPLALERNAVWRNRERNGLVVGAVHWLFENYGRDLQVLIAVRTVEHAVFLGALLPDWPLCYGSMDVAKRQKYERWGLIKAGDHPISARDRERMQEEFAAGTLRRVIATTSSNGVWSTGVDFPHLNALIRADAQAGSIMGIQIPGRVSRKSDGKEEGIVVDFDDGFNPLLRRRADRRFAMYRKKGWTIQALDLPTMTSRAAAR